MFRKPEPHQTTEKFLNCRFGISASIVSDMKITNSFHIYVAGSAFITLILFSVIISFIIIMVLLIIMDTQLSESYQTSQQPLRNQIGYEAQNENVLKRDWCFTDRKNDTMKTLNDRNVVKI